MRISSGAVLASVLLIVGTAGALYWASRPSREAGAPDVGGAPDARALYLAHCAACHGASGKGDGPGGAVVRTPLPDFTSTASMGQVDDAFLAEIIKKGGSQFGRSNAMPAWGMKLSDAEIQALVRYIRSLAQPGSSGPSASQ